MKNLFLSICICVPGMLCAQTGYVGINTTSPEAMLHVKDSSVLFSGSSDVIANPNDPPVTGTGVRMMWYPDKAAFRTGRAVNTSWDQSNIGNYSFAAGHEVKASGNYANAFGWNCTASAYGAFVAGENSTASGPNSIAMGINAKATGFRSFSFGDNTTASGQNSFSFGTNANATGLYGVAMGFNQTASGPFSLALGSESIAKGVYSSAIGHQTKAKGNGATAIGFNTQANGAGSIATGSFNDTIIPVQQTILENTPLFILGNGINASTRSNAMVVNYNGHTGIGTNYPQHRLHVKVNAPDVQIARFSGTGGYGEIVVDNATNEVDFGVSETWGYAGTKSGTDFRIRTGSLTRMTFQNITGNVGIGTTTPASTLEVNGSAAKPGGGSWIAPSDARLKQNVVDYTDGLSSLLHIRPVSYQYNAASGYDTDKIHVGVIAQELQQVATYMVSTSSKEAVDGTTNYLEVDNSAMVYMLINAVKEQQAIIAQLEQRIVKLEKK